jgi:hypothetical protein
VISTGYRRVGWCHGERKGCEDDGFHVWLSVFGDDDGDDGFTELDESRNVSP